jgi:uncharacterized membrane protein HdeD (DUF308 family)
MDWMEDPMLPRRRSVLALSSYWWLVALRGVAGVGLGLTAILSPGVVLAWLALVFVAFLLVDAVLVLICAMVAARHSAPWGALALHGMLDLAVATTVIVLPGMTLLFAVTFAGLWAVLAGALLLLFSIGWGLGTWLLAPPALVSLLLGVMLLLAPLEGVLVLVVWMGMYACVSGVALLAFAWHLRRQARQPNLLM